MVKKQNSPTKMMLYAAFVVIVLVIGLFIFIINNSFKNREKEYLAKVPDRVSSQALAQELRQISEKVLYFKNQESKIVEYPEHFNRRFVLIPAEGDNYGFGANPSYIPAESCLVFKTKLHQSDALAVIEDITKQGFDNSYIINKKEIAKDLGGDSYKFYSFSKNNRRLTINNTDTKNKLPARACLEKE